MTWANGTTFTIWRRTVAPSRAEVEYYLSAFTEEDAKYPEMFSQVAENLACCPAGCKRLLEWRFPAMEQTANALPPVTLGQYKGLPVTRRVRPVTEAAVASELKSLARRHAPFCATSAPAARGMRVTLDFEGFWTARPSRTAAWNR